MAQFRIELSSKARKFYASCQKNMADRLDACFEQLEKDPFHGPNIKRLKSHSEEFLYRYRIGQHRVLYEIFKKEVVVLIVTIAPRGDVYKGI